MTEEANPTCRPPFSYPNDDDTPYLEHFAGTFTSVFVALPPFLKLPGHPPFKNGDPVPDSAVHEAKLLGPTCGISWKEMADLSGFSSIRHVNRALGLTGSKRLSPKFANQNETDRLLEVCASLSIYPPDEGYPSPLLELAIGSFTHDLDQTDLISASSFGSFPKPLHSRDLLDKQKECDWVELWSRDHSLYCTIYIDYHYYLICQSNESLKRAKPHDYFEGFYADGTTNDFWGVGEFSGSPQPHDS